MSNMVSNILDILYPDYIPKEHYKYLHELVYLTQRAQEVEQKQAETTISKLCQKHGEFIDNLNECKVCLQEESYTPQGYNDRDSCWFDFWDGKGTARYATLEKAQDVITRNQNTTSTIYPRLRVGRIIKRTTINGKTNEEIIESNT